MKKRIGSTLSLLMAALLCVQVPAETMGIGTDDFAAEAEGSIISEEAQEAPDIAGSVSTDKPALPEILQGLVEQPEETVKDQKGIQGAGSGISEEVAASYQTVEDPDQGFETKCLADYYWSYVQEGCYISLGEPEEIPGILIARYRNDSRTPEEYLTEYVTPHMKEKYGDDLFQISKITEFEMGGKHVAEISYLIHYGSETLQITRIQWQAGTDLVEFAVAFTDEDSEEIFEALQIAIANFTFTDGTVVTSQPSSGPAGHTDTTGPQSVPGEEEGLEVVPSEASQVKYVSYEGIGGWFTVEIPEGWEYYIGTPPDYQMEFIGFSISAYDPAQPERAVHWILCSQGMPNSKESKEWWQAYQPDYPTAVLPAPEKPTTEGVFEALSGYKTSGYTDFETVCSLGQTPIGGEAIYGECTSAETGRRMSAFCTGKVQNVSMPVLNRTPENMWDFSTTDAGWLLIYDMAMISAPEGELSDWMPVMSHILGSITFSDDFYKLREREWAMINSTIAYVASIGSQIGDMIMDSWQKQSDTNFIISQKQSDATLGYERVYDTETGEYYKAENGFTDNYTGSRYQPADSDAAYLAPTAGTIYWK